MKETATQFSTEDVGYSNAWKLFSNGYEIIPESIMVFKSGIRRYAVIVCCRGDMLSRITQSDSHWTVINSSKEEFFCSLQWATEIKGSDLILLVGKEIFTQFNITA
ncbi:MAG: hypothetical protein H8D05_00435 [FCB group bacterium]|nr:hypothetical protein [FCB group bacterium]